ncbi:hypothetical protein [Deinococcus sp. LM3]|uniref:hypothetical protein n=1 Tax=Deinococcus sp. LM3 TaxID=1938608 RepID=UPI00117DDB64|nr:hypothetical protein [Deinococcus sp. LM3]
MIKALICIKGDHAMICGMKKILLATLSVFSCCGVFYMFYKVPEPKIKMLEKTCSENGNFKIGGMLDDGGVILDDRGFLMNGNGWIYSYLCKPGFITMNVTGISSDGVSPEININLNGQKFRSFKIYGNKNIKFEVPSRGLLTLGYYNDIFKVDLRMATFRNFRIVRTCSSDYKIETPLGSLANWDRVNDAWTVIKKSPAVILFPCGEGMMQLSAYGQSAANIFPKIELRQNDSLIGAFQLGEKETHIKISVDKSPIYISLVNPFARLLDNRDIRINSIYFESKVP